MTNLAHPLWPDYQGPDSGLAFGVHHDISFEWCWSFRERGEAIRSTKPQRELAAREYCLLYLDPTGQPWAAQWSKLSAQWDTLSAQWDKLIIRYTPVLMAQVRALLPDLDRYWDGHQLVFPGKD